MPYKFEEFRRGKLQAPEGGKKFRVTLPKEWVERLQWDEGDNLLLAFAPGGQPNIPPVISLINLNDVSNKTHDIVLNAFGIAGLYRPDPDEYSKWVLAEAESIKKAMKARKGQK